MNKNLMRPTRRYVIGRALGLVAIAASPAVIRAQPATDTPLKITLAFNAGGTSDFLARLYAPHVSATLGRPVIVDYKPGVNGVIGLNAVAKSRADGNTIILTDLMTLTATPWVMAKLPLKPIEELCPVAIAAYFPYVLVVNSALPIHNLADLKAYSLVNPGRFNLATGGMGTAQHLVGIEIAGRLGGLKWTYVPYKGASAALVDIVGGAVDGIVLSSPPVLPMLKAGRLRAIAVSGASRWSNLPDSPTFGEQGLADYQPGSYQGILAPMQTPRDMVTQLANAFNKAIQQPDVRARLAEQGGQTQVQTPQQLQMLLNEESARWGTIVKANHIVVE